MKPLWIETNQKSRTQDGVNPEEERQLDQNECELWYIFKRFNNHAFSRVRTTLVLCQAAKTRR